MIPWLTPDQLVNYTDNSRTIVVLINYGTYSDYDFIFWDVDASDWGIWDDYHETKKSVPLDTIVKFLLLD